MTKTATATRTYIIHFSTGTNRNDEKRYTKRVNALSFAGAANLADRLITLPGKGIVTSVELEGPVFA